VSEVKARNCRIGDGWHRRVEVLVLRREMVGATSNNDWQGPAYFQLVCPTLLAVMIAFQRECLEDVVAATVR